MGTESADPDDDESSVDLVGGYVRNSDSGAAERIYYRHRTAILQQARAAMSRNLQQRMDPEDIYQSVSLILLDGLRSGRFRVEKTGDLQALIQRLIQRRIQKKVENHSALKRSTTREVSLDSAGPVVADSPEASDQTEVRDFIEQFLSRIPNPRHRDVACLALSGCEVPEIAITTQYSQARVRQILQSVAAGVSREHRTDDT